MIEFSEDGTPFPAPGIDKDFDRIQEMIRDQKEQLDNELEHYKKVLNYKDLKYYHLKIRYQIQVPQHIVEGKNKPKEFIITSKVKGFLRFQTE